MSGPWIKSTDLRQLIAEHFHISDALLMKVADSMIDACNRSAWLEVQNFWLGKAYTQAQVDAWDRRIEFELDLATFWICTKNSIPFGYAQDDIDKLDRRRDLNDKLIFTISSVPVAPGDAGKDSFAGPIGYGRVSQTYLSRLPRWD